MFRKLLKISILISVLFSVNSYSLIFEEDLCICEKAKFSFKLPGDGWNYTIVDEAVNQENFIEVVVNLSYENDLISTYKGTIVKINIEDMNAVHLENYFTTIPSQMNLSDYTFIDTGSTIVDGNNAKWMILKYKPGYPYDENYTEIIKQVYIIKNLPNRPIPTAYIVTYISDEENFKKFYDLFEKIIKSFKLL